MDFTLCRWVLTRSFNLGHSNVINAAAGLPAQLICVNAALQGIRPTATAGGRLVNFGE